MTPWNPKTGFQDQASATLSDRRRSERTPPLQEGTHIWLTDNRRVPIKIVDESSTGIGAIIPDTSFTFGPNVELDYAGKRRFARVAYLNKTEDGSYRLGLEWIQGRDAQ